MTRSYRFKYLVSRRTAPDRQGCRQPLRHEEALTKKVRTLERKLVKEQREKLRVQATRARDAVERAEMEEFFMRCVEVRVIHRIDRFLCACHWQTLVRMHTTQLPLMILSIFLFVHHIFSERAFAWANPCQPICVKHTQLHRTSGEKSSRERYGSDHTDVWFYEAYLQVLEVDHRPHQTAGRHRRPPSK